MVFGGKYNGNCGKYRCIFGKKMYSGKYSGIGQIQWYIDKIWGVWGKYSGIWDKYSGIWDKYSSIGRQIQWYWRPPPPPARGP